MEDRTSIWEQRDRWHFWSSDKVVELRRSLIEYRPIETHQHFILPYEPQDDHSVAATHRDLREWDWIEERSKPVDESLRKQIAAEMRDAVAVGGTRLDLLNERLPKPPFEPLASVENVSNYLFLISNVLRDIGADDAADKAFYTAIGFSRVNPITSEFLENALSVLDALTLRGFPLRKGRGLRLIPEVAFGVRKWLSRR